MKNNYFHSHSQTPTHKNEAVNVPSVPEFPDMMVTGGDAFTDGTTTVITDGTPPPEPSQATGPVNSPTGAQAQQQSGEGSQANLARRAAIAAAARADEGDTSMPYTPGHPTCNLFVQRDVAKSGAPKPELKKHDGTMGAPGAAEWAGSKIPLWRFLKPGEAIQPGDIAARKENFLDATGHSGIVVSVSKSGVVTVMAAHPTVIGKDMTFQPGSRVYHNVFRRYTGD